MKISDIQVGDLLQWETGSWFVVSRIEIETESPTRFYQFWGLSLKKSRVVYLFGDYDDKIPNEFRVFRAGRLIDNFG